MLSTMAAPSTRTANRPRIPVPLSQLRRPTLPVAFSSGNGSYTRPVLLCTQQRCAPAFGLERGASRRSGADEVDQAGNDLHTGEGAERAATDGALTERAHRVGGDAGPGHHQG